MADTEKEAERLLGALTELSREYADRAEAAVLPVTTPPMLSSVLSPREAFFSERESVPLEKAAGRVAAEEIAFYPPGIPAIVPGERITPEAIGYLRETARIGLKVTGPQDPSLSTICVVK
jgi:arginine/lysine/ornithine decarboxylase